MAEREYARRLGRQIASGLVVTGKENRGLNTKKFVLSERARPEGENSVGLRSVLLK